MIVYINKILICVLCLIGCFASCRTSKESRQNIAHDQQIERQVAASMTWAQYAGRDSASRYWMFLSDSSFYFHPDEGLWGRSGKVAYIERKGGERSAGRLDMVYDSLGTIDSRLQSDSVHTETRPPIRRWLWLLLIPLAIVGWVYRKR
ncbi:hypothetical protein [Sphingobacterium paucimobilis]|uniref:Uncharacterized protein n=1 Tax=Sphingobacterium paucimobilis HER1398 TaxID=1346330 RepID=U2H6V7_9SPHI|nr:hypothetical protein [Sphingobacterium paucimobilis]ERJ57441.1 hypothetical protein M472_01545 [Sphingobacterium paucimobilis HER1398]